MAPGTTKSRSSADTLVFWAGGTASVYVCVCVCVPVCYAVALRAFGSKQSQGKAGIDRWIERGNKPRREEILVGQEEYIRVYIRRHEQKRMGGKRGGGPYCGRAFVFLNGNGTHTSTHVLIARAFRIGDCVRA